MQSDHHILLAIARKKDRRGEFGFMPIPHTFPGLVDIHEAGSSLIVGAGLSSKIAPSLSELAAHVAATHTDVVRNLGVDPSPPPLDADDFYNWAQRAIDALVNQLQLSHSAAKVRLADAVGVTTDPRYRLEVTTLPLRLQWARHRVVARLAREKRWKAIWSLNWDCVLETALESVGLSPHPEPGANRPSSMPWDEWYLTWSPGDTAQPNSHNGTFYLCKPHGCVRKLAATNPLFIVTRRELNELTAQLRPAAVRMGVSLTDARLVTLGWKASESYICAHIDSLGRDGALSSAVPDRLSIANRTWYPETADTTHHQRVATAYGIDRRACFFEVEKGGKVTLDDLLLWVQSRYFLNVLIGLAADGPWSTRVIELQALLVALDTPQPNHIINSIADNFVAVWVRLCFNSGGVQYFRRGVALAAPIPPTDRRDEHIPWMYDQTARPDLLATIPLVLKLCDPERANDRTTWNLDEFPGALWDCNTRHLVLPLPIWGNAIDGLGPAGLKSLMESRSWEKKGTIQKLSVLSLDALPNPPHTDADFGLRSAVAQFMKHGALATTQALSAIVVDDI